MEMQHLRGRRLMPPDHDLTCRTGAEGDSLFKEHKGA